MIGKESKITAMILLAIVIILTIVITPLAIMNMKEKDKENFPSYNQIDITENKIENQYEYSNIKNQLQNDYYFSKLGIMIDYESRNYNSRYLEQMLWNLIFNYELSNKDYFTFTDSKNGIYCMTEKNLLAAFYELYDVDVSKNVDYLKGYYKYIYKGKNGYCLDFKRVGSEYDNKIKIAVEKIGIIGVNITTDIYVYEYYISNTETEKNYEKALTQYINAGDIANANNVVINYLRGTISKKQLTFRINNNGKFFKYKVLTSKKIQ